MTTIQKWLTGLIGLGALYLIVSKPTGVAAAGVALNKIIGGTETSIITGGTKGGA